MGRSRPFVGDNGCLRQIRLMARDDLFESKRRDATASPPGYAPHMIRTVMNRSDWLTLIGLAVIWGSAFFCIHVAVHAVPPLTYVYDSRGDKQRTIEFRASGVLSPGDLFFTADRRLIASPGCYSFNLK